MRIYTWKNYGLYVIHQIITDVLIVRVPWKRQILGLVNMKNDEIQMIHKILLVNGKIFLKKMLGLYVMLPQRITEVPI